MKTSDASSKPPVQRQQSSSSSKAEQKPKPSQKQFQEVLQEGKPKQTLAKGKQFAPLEKKSDKPAGEGRVTIGNKATQQKAEGETKLHSRIEPKEERDAWGPLQKKHSKEEVSEKHSKEEVPGQLSQPISPNLAQQQGPAPVEGSKAVSETGNPALNISEIESIVKQVQVGVNEKGLPEMNFELHTENLGDMSLKVNAENDQISIQFVTQDAAAQDLLNQNLKELNQLLHNKGLNIAELDVRTRDDESRQQRQQQQESSGEQNES